MIKNDAWKSHLPVVIILTVATLCFVMFFTYMQILHPLTPFMDALGFFRHYENSELGKASILSTWNAAEHRALLSQIIFYLNAKLFNYSVFGLAVCSGFVISLTGILIGVEQHRSMSVAGQRKVNLMMFSGLVAITFFTLFSLANWELYSLELGFVLFAKNFIFIIYWIGLGRVLLSPARQLVLRVSLLLTGPVIVLFVAAGWSYAFVAASIICAYVVRPANTESRTFRIWLLVALAGSQLAYVTAGFLTVGQGAFHPTGTIASFNNAITGVIYALSSIFMGSETLVSFGVTMWVKLFIFVLLIAVIAWIAFMVISRRVEIPFLPLAFILYASMHVAAVSYARGRFGPDLAMAPRYYMDLSLLLIGVVWCSAFFIAEGQLSQWLNRIGYTSVSALIVIFLIGQGITTKDEWTKAPYRHEAFSRMREITLWGVETPEQASFLQQPFSSAKQGAEVQRRYSLGPFKDINCTSPFHVTGWFHDGWIGKEATSVIRNCEKSFRFKVFTPEVFPVQILSISINGNPPYLGKTIPGQGFPVVLPIQTGTYLNVTMKIEPAVKPSDLGNGGGDVRTLGVMVSDMSTEKSKESE